MGSFKSVIVCCVFFIFASGDCFASGVGIIQQELEKSVSLDIDTGKLNQKWLEEKDELAREITNLKIKNAWLTFKNRKYDKYIEGQKQLIAELEEKRDYSQRLRMELEPWIDETVKKLELDIEKDLPFLMEERLRRMEFLKKSMGDYHVGLGEKLRKTLEALKVEAGYGKDIEKTHEVINLDGVKTRVSVIRVGRLGMYYITPDNKSGGVWINNKGEWEKAEAELLKNIARLSDMLARKRVTRLVHLPMGGAK